MKLTDAEVDEVMAHFKFMTREVAETCPRTVLEQIRERVRRGPIVPTPEEIAHGESLLQKIVQDRSDGGHALAVFPSGGVTFRNSWSAPFADDTVSDLEGVETRESVAARIRDVEARLARTPAIADAVAGFIMQGGGDVTKDPETLHQLIVLASWMNLHPFDVETELAHEWYSAYAAYKDWETSES